ncbi:putative ABC transport system permease protein [Agreia bicolorata]|uniref:Putative ABC transport system permease protein n=1 Tax=Agreia bicolorata TaxID=110935 RepID=A0A1T4WRQ8_9MICO|nr:ABC transporter permease [Agreia bicolorata]SKA79939.1 putative ABC transport system permease protein [Agreia bicolorata]
MSLGETLRGHRPSILVSALGAAFGSCLLTTIAGLQSSIEGIFGPGASFRTAVFLLHIVAGTFFGIALFVGAIVTANTFSAVVAGRVQTIALYRLLGASAQSQRRVFLREGGMVGIIGAVTGVLVGIVLGLSLLAALVANGSLTAAPASVPATVAFPLVAGVVTTTAAAWVGSRAVLAVSPLQAIEAAQEAPFGAVRRRGIRTGVGFFFVIAGLLGLALGVVVSLDNPNGLFIAMLGGMASFTGFVICANLFIPRALNLVGKLFGSGPESRLARANSLRNPERSTRASIGIVIGVTLVTMFCVALSSMNSFFTPEVQADPDNVAAFQAMTAVAVGLVGFSVIIAAVGVVNDLSISVLQRRREIGLLRALGFTGPQVQRTIVTEAAHMAITSVLLGLLLGTTYGWVGVQCLYSRPMAGGGFVVPTVPPLLVASLIAATVVLTLAAVVVPARTATAVSPIDALQR